MIIRFFAVSLFILSGAFCGVYLSEKLKSRVTVCSEAEKLMRLCIVMIRTSGSDIFRIIRVLKNERMTCLKFLCKLPENYTADCDIRRQWRSAVGSDRFLPEEERSVLTELGCILGTTDIEGQISAISSQLLRMEELREQRRQEYLQKGRLYRSLGVMAGVSVGIILI